MVSYIGAFACYAPSVNNLPIIDAVDRATGGIAQAGNVVGAFDWALGFRWENIDASDADLRLHLPPDKATAAQTACCFLLRALVSWPSKRPIISWSALTQP